MTPKGNRSGENGALRAPEWAGGFRVGRRLRLLGAFLGYTFARFFNDRMFQAVGALTYSTLLAIVPVLVIAFAILSGFPAFDAVQARMQSLVYSALVPAASEGLSDYFNAFTANADNLTAAGVVALSVTAILLLSTIEATFNTVWRVDRERPLLYRMLIYWTILTLGPLLLGTSFSVTSDLARELGQWAGGEFLRGDVVTAWYGARRLIAVVIETGAFALLFVLVPARTVRMRHALLGGLIAAIAFEILKWGFGRFISSGSTYATIYGAVAVIPIFLIWIYSSWLVIVFGAVFAASLPDWAKQRAAHAPARLTQAQRLQVAMGILSVLHGRAKEGGTVNELRLSEAVPAEAREHMLEQLHHAGYVAYLENDDVVLARDLHRTTLLELAADLDLLLGRHGREEGNVTDNGARPSEIATDRLLSELARAERKHLGEPVADILDRADQDRRPKVVADNSDEA